MNAVKHLLYWLLIARKSGLDPTPEDFRDFQTGVFNWFGYSPKHTRHIVQTVSVKNQGNLNTCFPPRTKVLMEDFSYEEIKNIRPGDIVLSGEGNRQKVIGTMKRVWQGNIFSLKLWGDFREIEATPEHPFLCLKNDNPRNKNSETVSKGNLSYIEIKNLSDNDWVAFPFNDIVEDKTLYSYEKDPDFLWLLGLYMAEASASTNQVVFSLHRNETEYFKRIKNIMARYGIVVNSSFRGENGLAVYFTSKKWKNVFEELGGKYCDKKRINKRLMTLSPSLQMNIFDGLFAGDGYLHPDGYKIIHITSYKLLSQIRTILLRNKKYSLFRKHTAIEGKKPSWSLSLSDSNKYCHIKDGYVLVKIKSISKKTYFGGYVHNLEVETDNSYQVNGVAVHNCQWNATIAQKEIDEKSKLSVRQMVSKGKRMGLVSGDGFSNLRSGQKVLQEWGAVEEGVIKEEVSSWAEYSGINSDLYTDRASRHKISSFWSVSSRNDLLKLLDADKTVTTGMMWYTGFNQGGGFKAPWLITRAIGYKVGGHAVLIVGYDMNYQGRKVYIIQNSYGKDWGDNGKFYIDMSYLDGNSYGYFTNLDEIDKTLGKFITDYDGKNVKAKGNPAIYHIQSGNKKLYPTWLSYLAWNGKRRGFVEVEKAILDKVPNDDIMDIKKSDYWEFIKDVKESNQLDLLLELIHKEG